MSKETGSNVAAVEEKPDATGSAYRQAIAEAQAHDAEARHFVFFPHSPSGCTSC